MSTRTAGACLAPSLRVSLLRAVNADSTLRSLCNRCPRFLSESRAGARGERRVRTHPHHNCPPLPAKSRPTWCGRTGLTDGWKGVSHPSHVSTPAHPTGTGVQRPTRTRVVHNRRKRRVTTGGRREETRTPRMRWCGPATERRWIVGVCGNERRPRHAGNSLACQAGCPVSSFPSFPASRLVGGHPPLVFANSHAQPRQFRELLEVSSHTRSIRASSRSPFHHPTPLESKPIRSDRTSRLSVGSTSTAYPPSRGTVSVTHQ